MLPIIAEESVVANGKAEESSFVTAAAAAAAVFLLLITNAPTITLENRVNGEHKILKLGGKAQRFTLIPLF